MKLTPTEIRTERQVIIDTRLGMLCEGRPPTSEQYAIATAEADAWVKSVSEPQESELMAWAKGNLK